MHSVRQRLGQLLVDARILTPEKLAEALELQKKDGRRLGTLLVELGLVNETQLTQILSQQLNAPWVSLHHIDFSRQLLNLVPREIADRFCLIPIYVRHVRGQGDTLYVAMDDPSNDDALRACAASAGLPARAMIAPPSDIRRAIQLYYSSAGSVSRLAKGTLPSINTEAVSSLQPPTTVPAVPAAMPRAVAPTLDDVNLSSAPVSHSQGQFLATPAPAPVVQVINNAPGSSPSPATAPSGAPAAVAASGYVVMPQSQTGRSQSQPPPPNSDAVRVVSGENGSISSLAEAAANQPTEPAPTTSPSTPPSPGIPARTGAMSSPELNEHDEVPEITVTSEQTISRGTAASAKHKMISVTLLDGTTIAVPTRSRRARRADDQPESHEHGDELSSRDVIAALRAAALGADASDVLGDNPRWELMFAALLSLLLKKHLITDKEFIEEFKKFI